MIVIFLLNPTSISFYHMDEPSPELRMATMISITERGRLQGKVVDLADSLRRVEYLGDELSAWKELSDITGLTVAEFKSWPHFEYRYLVGSAQAELTQTRETICEFIAAQMSGEIYRNMMEVIRTPEEILAMSDH